MLSARKALVFFLTFLMFLQTSTAIAADANYATTTSFETDLEAIEAAEDFADLTSTDWFYNDVMKAKQLGLISGMGNNLFKPDNAITYAEYITVLIRVLGTDVDKYPLGSHWADQYLEAARELGIVNGLEEEKQDSPIPGKIWLY